MSASMAEVLAEHQLYVNTSRGDAWNPPEESASCSCGVDLGGWVASGADWEWPDGWGKEHGEHVAEQLATNGYGSIRAAAAVGWDAAVGQMVYEDGTPVQVATNDNPYRRPE